MFSSAFKGSATVFHVDQQQCSTQRILRYTPSPEPDGGHPKDNRQPQFNVKLTQILATWTKPDDGNPKHIDSCTTAAHRQATSTPRTPLSRNIATPALAPLVQLRLLLLSSIPLLTPFVNVGPDGSQNKLIFFIWNNNNNLKHTNVTISIMTI